MDHPIQYISVIFFYAFIDKTYSQQLQIKVHVTPFFFLGIFTTTCLQLSRTHQTYRLIQKAVQGLLRGVTWCNGLQLHIRLVNQGSRCSIPGDDTMLPWKSDVSPLFSVYPSEKWVTAMGSERSCKNARAKHCFFLAAALLVQKFIGLLWLSGNTCKAL